VRTFVLSKAVRVVFLVESLLIDAFAKANALDKIQQNGEFMMLQGIIIVAKGRQHIRLARGSDRILDDIKYVGDRGAHNVFKEISDSIQSVGEAMTCAVRLPP
jgi:hypothetical protein